MSSLKRYNEVCTRHQMIGTREFNTGDVVRTVAISERDAAINNSMTKEHGYKYVLTEVKAKEPNKEEIRKESFKKTADDFNEKEHGIKHELTEKEIRAGYFAKATDLGLNPAKNIKTDELKKLVE